MLEYVIEQQSSVICLLVIINLNQGTELFVLPNTEQNTDIWKEQNSTKQWLTAQWEMSQDLYHKQSAFLKVKNIMPIVN